MLGKIIAGAFAIMGFVFVVLIALGTAVGDSAANTSGNNKEQMRSERYPASKSKKTEEEEKKGGPDKQEDAQDIENIVDVESVRHQPENDINLPSKYIENFKAACGSCGIDVGTAIDFRKMDDWANGERYSFLYNGETYLIYFIDNGDISSINDSNLNKIYQNPSPETNQNGGGKIILIEGKVGEYGKEDDFGGYKQIRYYVPPGKYIVSCQTQGSGFYIESIEKHLENGYETSDTHAEMKFSNVDEKYEIEITDGECLLLIANSIVELAHIN